MMVLIQIAQMEIKVKSNMIAIKFLIQLAYDRHEK